MSAIKPTESALLVIQAIVGVGDYNDPTNLADGATLQVPLVDRRVRIASDWADEELTAFEANRFLSSLGMLEFDADGRALAIGGAARYLRATAD